MIDAALKLRSEHPVRAMCDALGASRSTLIRRSAATVGKDAITKSRAYRPTNALSQAERIAVLDILNSQRFVDLAPAQVHAQLLDDGVYLCSISTMYRLMRSNDQIRERRRLARHPE